MYFLIELLIISSIFYQLQNDETIYESWRDANEIDSYMNMTDMEHYPDVCQEYENESCAEEWLKKIDYIRKRNSNRMSNIFFRYSTDINKENDDLKLKFQRQTLNVAPKIKAKILKFKWRQFKSPRLKRIFHLLSPSSESKNKTILEAYLKVNSQIKSIYNNAKPCFGYCLKKGETGIEELFAVERDYDTLKGFWTSWRNETGRKIKELFLERMRLQNIGARENGEFDAASYKVKSEFEETNFNETALRLYDEILPLYKELHGYVRHCLWKFYPTRFNKTDPIPAHLLGNLWGQSWNNILPIIQRCRNETPTYSIQEEVTKHLQSKSVIDMFKIAEEFFTSIGMYKMTPKFWERSVFEQIPGKLIDCHGSAHNFFSTFDFRIKMCTKRTFNDFTTVHHEMGHVQQYMAYRDLPYAFMGSANSGFHEAIGDTIALSVKTPVHLKKIGLIPEIPATKDFDLEYLLSTALERVAFLPFALMMDSYIWGIYNGSVPLERLNEHWWDLRYRLQGLKSPVRRNEEDFDPAGKYHISFGLSYLRYFVSYILQFQLYDSMCQLSGYDGPLHQCDFYQSKPAGERLLKMLKEGRGQHWRDVLKILTGTREMSSKSLLKYFDPLYTWLKETNSRLKIPIGW